MATHRYWRLYCRKTAGATDFVGVTEIEMATSAAGADVTSTAFAIGSGSYQAGTASDAFDNDFTGDVLQWDITELPGVWVGQNFGAGNEKDIVEVRVRPNKDAANRTFGEFDVQFSDDNVTWTTAWSVTKTSGYVVGTTFTFTPPSAAASRYWRVRGENVSNMSCAEMEMRESAGGADATGSGTPTASSTFDGTTGAAKAFDNSAATLWSSANVSVLASEWIRYDFGVGVTKDIQEISYQTRNDAFFAQAPASGWVESSADAVNWLPRKYFSGLSWSAGATNLITLVAGAGGRRRQVINC